MLVCLDSERRRSQAYLTSRELVPGDILVHVPGSVRVVAVFYVPTRNFRVHSHVVRIFR